MLKRGQTLILLLLAAVMLIPVFISGCSSTAAAQNVTTTTPTPAPTTTQYYTPTVFKMAVGLAIDQTTAEAQYAEVKKYFSEQLGMPVELYVPTDYTAMIQAMLYKHIDLGFQGPFSYVISRTEFPCIPIAGSGVNGQMSTYNSFIAVRKDSPITSMADLVANAKNINFAFVDPDSTSGCLMPTAGLAEAGITNPKTQFKNVVYAGGHDAVILSIIAGKTDAGGIGRDLHVGGWDPVKLLEDANSIPKDDLRYIWTSQPIPPTPFQVRADLDPALVAKIKDAILNMKTRDFAAYKEYNSSAKPDDASNFVAVSPSDYDYLSSLAKAMGMIK